ncbi:MAG: dGTP triphosphohydrolase [Planctomycetota bacterium]
MHSSAFRRLEYKTQVLINTAGDHYRTRLTHTLEVANLSRGIARALGLNEDLCEAQALAHDLGHPPFGHSGEGALNTLMKDFGGFEHNRQGLRVVEELERRYPDRGGLNLTYEVRETFAKNYPPPLREKLGFRADEQINLEAQVCSFADAFAYECHDIDDGLTCGMIKLDDLSHLELVRAARAKAEQEFPSLAGASALSEGRVEPPRPPASIDSPPRPAPPDAPLPEAAIRRQYLQKRLVRNLLDTVVNDAMAATADRLTAAGIGTLDDVRAQAGFLVASSPAVQAQRKELRAYLYKHFYMHPDLQAHFQRAHGWLRELFDALRAEPAKLPDWFRAQHAAARDEAARARVVCDYIAGCTDRYVTAEYTRVVGKELHHRDTEPQR